MYSTVVYIISSVCVCVQVIGEYAYVTEDINIEDVLEKITALMNNEFHGMCSYAHVLYVCVYL